MIVILARTFFTFFIEFHPANKVFIIGMFMVALDRNAGDARALQSLQRGDRMVQGQRVNGAAIEFIAAGIMHWQD